MRNSAVSFAVAGLLMLGAVPSPDAVAANLMTGKTRTDRTVQLEVTVDCPAAEVYRLWTTAEGVKSFFAPDARIDARPGGRYEIVFVPDRDPEGRSHGTAGARVLKLDPDREVAFEWITFAADTTLGANAPPIAPRSLRDRRPLPTWVTIHLDPAPEDSGRTRMRFTHAGFRSGPLWERSFKWFSRAWAGVLESLAAHCREAE